MGFFVINLNGILRFLKEHDEIRNYKLRRFFNTLLDQFILNFLLCIIPYNFLFFSLQIQF